MNQKYGRDLRSAVCKNGILQFIGVYDVFSATIAAHYSKGIFISGFGFAASYYGLPDIGFNAWPDIVNFVQRVRTVLPHQCILVDIDDGFCDVEVACHVVSMLETIGASGVILEDQRRPRRCGHLGNKQIMPLGEFLEKLDRVLQSRSELFVVARTDASDREDIMRRVQAFSQTDADAILVDGIGDLTLLDEIRAATDKPICFNQIVGGAPSRLSMNEMKEHGVSLAIFSTPCLFAAQHAIRSALSSLDSQGILDDNSVTLQDCNSLLESNLHRRNATDQSDLNLLAPKPRSEIQ